MLALHFVYLDLAVEFRRELGTQILEAVNICRFQTVVEAKRLQPDDSINRLVVLLLGNDLESFKLERLIFDCVGFQILNLVGFQH